MERQPEHRQQQQWQQNGCFERTLIVDRAAQMRRARSTRYDTVAEGRRRGWVWRGFEWQNQTQKAWHRGEHLRLPSDKRRYLQDMRVRDALREATWEGCWTRRRLSHMVQVQTRVVEHARWT